jgi:hypothetical protein
MWNYWMGGKDNYQVDRDAGDAFAQLYPDMFVMARQSRQFSIRVVRYLAAEAGVRQFLDIGTGLPVEPNTHEVAQVIAPDSKIVYVDNDHTLSGSVHSVGPQTAPTPRMGQWAS